MALPNTGITTTMVGQELGISTRNVGNLCRSEAINKWSKWKPVRINKIDGITTGNIRSVRAGMNIPNFTNIQDLMSYYRSNPSATWGYNKPRGGNNSPSEPYRIGDFRNYEHTAQKFYNIFIPDKVFSPTNVGINLDIVSTNSYWLNWDSLMMDNFYFGALAIRSGASTPPFNQVLATTPLGTSMDSESLEITLPSASLGQTFQIFTFLGEVTTYPNINAFWVLENGMKSVTYSPVITVMFTSNWSGSNLNWTLTITNNATTNISMSGAHIFFRYGDNDITDPTEPGELDKYLSSPITVLPSTPTVITGTEFGILPNFSTRSGYAYFMNATYPQSNQMFYLDDF